MFGFSFIFIFLSALCFWCGLTGAAPAMREGSSLIKLPLSEASRAIEPPTYSLQLQNSQYVNASQPAFRDGASSQNTSAIFRVHDALSVAPDLRVEFDIKNEYSDTEKWNYFDAHELYAKYHTDLAEISIGRKLDNWSEGDSEWQQGLFQPRYQENQLRPEAAGLVGVFVSTHTDHWAATVGALPIFIPDFGAHYEVENGTFIAKNPWFHAPSTSFIYNMGVGDIRYSVNTPKTKDVVLNGGGIGKVEYRNAGYLGRLSYAYKPMEQLLMGFPSDNRYITGSEYMSIEVNPRVVYDRVINLDNQVEIGRWTFSSTVAHDNPDYKPWPTNWTAQQLTPATIVSGSGSVRLEDAGPHAARVELGFLKVYGGLAADTGRFASDGQSLFEQRFQYFEAYMLAFKKEFRTLLNHPLDTEVRVIYDRLQGGGAVSLNSGMNFTRELRAELELDFLGLLSSADSISDGFLSTYRANDRVGLGVSYVF